ncbi:hypothetical protein [Tenacibaculum discolor]|uniref:hypothetical protein n=1 Tax=Tenacibaculum discolor TaxID=361581 RepID=UPI000EADE89F|nr:hypothetical protein [Tenacibaculum discolor]RLK07711.1 hypothetical protein C8N27_0051 [Tenacibaculum discolor]
MNKKRKNYSSLLGGFLAISIIIGILTYELRKDYLILNYKRQVTGTIIKYDASTAKHSVKYKYKVNGKLYFKTVRVQHFSKDERKNCKGKKVIVNYSYKEPSYSHVNLGEYEYKKRTFYLLNSF